MSIADTIHGLLPPARFSFVDATTTIHQCNTNLSKGRGSLRGEDLALLGSSTVGKRELQVLGEELLDVRTTDGLGALDLNDLEDLQAGISKNGRDGCWYKTYVNRPEARTVTGGHVLVESLDGVGSRHLAVLLVHVVGAGAGVVTDPDTEVLDLEGALLVNLKTITISQCFLAG